jgi:hypothetical protein
VGLEERLKALLGGGVAVAGDIDACALIGGRTF